MFYRAGVLRRLVQLYLVCVSLKNEEEKKLLGIYAMRL